MKRAEAGQNMADCISYKDEIQEGFQRDKSRKELPESKCQEGFQEKFQEKETWKDCMGNGHGWQQADSLLKSSLQSIGARIEASDSLKQRIDVQIGNRSVKEERGMKHISIKKVAIGVAAACLAVGMVTIAGRGLVSISGHGSSIPDYTKFEDMGKAESEIGYSVNVVENFSNGFRFEGISIIEQVVENEAGESLGERKGLSVEYAKGKEELAVYISKMFPGEGSFSSEDWDKTLNVGDITVGYSKDTYKAVPPDYELTEEDKANMEKGHFQLAYGSEQVEISQSYYVGWIKDGIQYSINGFDLSLSGDELLNMAKEIIESEAE